MRSYRSILLSTAIGLSACILANAQTGAEPDKPRLIAQFRDAQNEWHKITVETLNLELSKAPGLRAFIRVRNDKGLLNRIQLLRKGAIFAKLDERRLTYLIVDSQDYDTESYIVKTCEDIPTCEQCVAIRASDLDRLDRLIRIRRIAKRR